MKVGIIGSGGREHAICKFLNISDKIDKIYCFPGNAGTKQIAENIEIDLENFENIKNFTLNNKIDFLIVGPEKPLVDGIVDYLEEHNIKVFGPNKLASQLEGSKIFTKKLCENFNSTSNPRLIERKYVLAASTHKDEERQIITEWLKVNDKRILLVIVPRHPERLGDILSDIPLDIVKVCIRSKNEKVRNNTQIYIADTFGELESFIEHSEFIFFGGSLVDHGGQNFLEAAAYGKSIIVGPYMYNFIDETEEFLKANSMIMVKNSQSLKHVFEKLIKSKQRRELFGSNAKALLQSKSKTMDHYKNIILDHLK